MKVISITQARNNLAELINQVAYGSQTIIIEKMKKPVAALVNINSLNIEIKPRKKATPPSSTAGTIALPPDLKIEKVWQAIKEPYDRESLFGR